MSEAYLNKDDCLARAKCLLASGDPAALRYACLELRFCIESVTYEKLRAYASRLPPDVLARWQPPQAVAALLELEDDAAQEYTVAFGLRRGDETGPLQVIGEHRTFAPVWLRKNYNKLGGLLHVPNSTDPAQASRRLDAQELRQYLDDLVAECDRVVASSITSTIARLVEFKCQQCGRKTATNAEGAKRRGRVPCLHPGCSAEHDVTPGEDGALYFTLTGSVFPCLGCGHKQLVPAKSLETGHEFACEVCGCRHKLIDRVWRYAPEVERPEEPR